MDHFFTAAEKALLQAVDDAEEPIRIKVTSEIYRHLHPGEEWRKHSFAATHYGEAPIDLYQLPTTIENKAWHEFKFYCRSGAVFDERGRVSYP